MNTLLLIDANSLIHRCFHALPPFTNSESKPTGALYGLSSVLIKILKEQPPNFIAAFFDRPEPTFRKEMFEEYKIHRPKAPDALVAQIIEAHNLLDAFRIKNFESPGFEADDLIGTAVEKFKDLPDLKIIILTGDLDALQLIDNSKICVKTFKKGISDTLIYDADAVQKRFGVMPGQLPDYKGLIGDASDNIPGVSGIGPKTASVLIQKYGNLDNFFQNGLSEKFFAKINQSKETALLSRRLAAIRRDAPLAIGGIEELEHNGLKKEIIVPYFENMGFKSLISRIEPMNLF